MASGAVLHVVAWTASRLKSGSSRASTAARTTGMCSGRQPASTALTAIFSTVATPSLGGTMPTTWEGSLPEARIMASTFSRVGGTTGRPSLQPSA